MVRKDRKEQPWRPKTHGLRLIRSQKFVGPHEKDTRSPRFKSKKSDAGSSASEKGSPVSPRERSNTIGERGGVPPSIRSGISSRDRGNTFSYGTEDEYEDVQIQRFKGKNANHDRSDDNAEAKEPRKVITSRNGGETNADRYPAPLASPDIVRSEANAELAHEEAANEESYEIPNDEGIPRIRDFGSLRPRTPETDHSIDETSDQEDQAVSDLSQEPEETETLSKTSPSPHSKERDSLDSQLQQSGSGPILVDAGPIHDPVEEALDLGIDINDEAPATTRCPDAMEHVDASPVHRPFEEPVDLGIDIDAEALDATRSPGITENVDGHTIHEPHEEPVHLDINMNDKAPDSTHSPDTTGNVDSGPINNPAEEQVDLETAMDDEAPDGTHLPNSIENADQDVQLMSGNGEIAFSRPRFTGSIHVRSPISQLGSPGIGHFGNPRSQPSLARDDQIEGPHPQPQPPEPGRVSVETSPTKKEVEAWLKDPSDLPENYYEVYPENPIPSRPAELPSSPSSHSESVGTGSLIVSPDEQESSEEDEDPWVSRFKTDLLARYRDNLPPSPPTDYSKAMDERGAEAGTDRQHGTSRRRLSWLSSVSTKNSGRSLLLSPDGDGNENPTDDITMTKEEEAANKAKMNLLEVYKANYDLQTKLELKEANFKQEIQKAWKHPRPPPTTSEQRADQRALDKIESLKIFDEIGDQQRPIKTNPQMVVWETIIDIMITRARISYLLEDFPKMYMHANHAVAAASQLRFPPLTAMCCYYRGIASYHHREFPTAKSDFEASRGCAGLFGVSSEVIEKHIDLIDSTDDPETAILERFPAPRSKSIVKRAKRTAVIPNIEPSQKAPPADDAPTLDEGSSRSAHDTALPLSDEEGSIGQTREDTDSQIKTSRRSSPLDDLSLEDDPPPSTDTDDDVPNYKPQEEAISEEIRKSIFESKAQSLDAGNEAGLTVADAQEKQLLYPPSMASTEWTLLGSATSQGTARRVSRPHIAPIDTSLANATRPAVGGVSAEANTGEDYSGEMDEDEIMAAFNTKREDATPDTGYLEEEETERVMDFQMHL